MSEWTGFKADAYQKIVEELAARPEGGFLCPKCKLFSDDGVTVKFTPGLDKHESDCLWRRAKELVG